MKLQLDSVELHPGVVESIKQHAHQQASKGGYEAVGFIASKGQDCGVAVLRFNNHAPNPREAFLVEPWEQYQAERKLSQEGYEVLGVYHSHVRSEALPSMFDHKMARPGEYVFIYSVAFGDLKAYREEDGTLIPVELIVEGADDESTAGT